MSFSEVRNLRKEGKLTDALEIAKNDLENNPEDIWNKRSIGWVYFDYLKQAQVINDVNELLLQLKNIKDLELPNTEQMLFDSTLWPVSKFLTDNKEINPATLYNIFNNIKHFEFTKPNNAYSFLLKGFKSHAATWNGFSDFIHWWGLDNFQSDDYKNFKLDNGNTIPSLVEGVYIAVSKILLNNKDIESIKKFIPKIAEISAKHKNMQYPPFYLAKLLLAVGDKEHFLEAFLPFAKKKSREFWVWNLMSENFDTSTAEYFSCLCKAASCGGQDKFTGDVREKLAEVFIAKNQFSEAKFELQKIIDSRIKEGWALKDKHQNWQNSEWWNTATASKNNKAIYNSNLNIAESLLFTDIPEEIAIIERVNKEKSIFNFLVSKNKWGFSSYKGFKIQPKAGDLYAIRFKVKDNKPSKFYNILTISESTKEPLKDVYKNISGKLTIRNTNNFGFLNNAFVSPQLIKENNLKDGDPIVGKAIISFNSRKNSWGWNLIKIKK